MELACEDDRQIVRVPLVFDEAKMKKRIEKDIKRGRLTRVRSSDSFLEGKQESTVAKLRASTTSTSKVLKSERHSFSEQN